MDYRVYVTDDAYADLDRCIYYLLFVKRNEQAARSVMQDFEETKERLAFMAGSIKVCSDHRLRELGYRRINFQSHRYFMLYRVEGDTVVVDNIFHELQDYQNKMF